MTDLDILFCGTGWLPMVHAVRARLPEGTSAGVRSLWLALGGLAFGLSPSAALSGLVGRFVFGVDALDPLSYLGGAVTVLHSPVPATSVSFRTLTGHQYGERSTHVLH